jgi:hypothetical protein
MINYWKEYQSEKLRADLLQEDLNTVDEDHFDEVSQLRAQIVFLKRQILYKKVN